jgi:biopolymer transport protein ExbB/TolQ
MTAPSNSSQDKVQPSDAFLRLDRTVLSWSKVDPERRFGLPAGPDTSPHPVTTILLAAIAAAAVYLVAWWIRMPLGRVGDVVWDLLTGYSGIPIGIVLLSLWASSILLIKWRKIAAQRKALAQDLLPPDPAFRLTRKTVDDVIDRIEGTIEQPDKFLLFDRLISVLRNVRNVGRVGDIDEMFASASDADEASMESSYTVVRGFIWAIPVLGFIGTILGLTEAISRFGNVLGGPNQQTGELTKQLGDVIAGLDTAFVTTGEGLVAALLLQLAMVSVRRMDEKLLDALRTACTKHILSRVRIMEVEDS